MDLQISKRVEFKQSMGLPSGYVTGKGTLQEWRNQNGSWKPTGISFPFWTVGSDVMVFRLTREEKGSPVYLAGFYDKAGVTETEIKDECQRFDQAKQDPRSNVAFMVEGRQMFLTDIALYTVQVDNDSRAPWEIADIAVVVVMRSADQRQYSVFFDHRDAVKNVPWTRPADATGYDVLVYGAFPGNDLEDLIENVSE